MLPLTFGECEWADATGVLNGRTAPIDPTKTPVYGVEIALAVNYDTKQGDRAPSYNGHDYTGGFGWLEHPTGICEVNGRPERLGARLARQRNRQRLPPRRQGR